MSFKAKRVETSGFKGKGDRRPVKARDQRQKSMSD